MQPRPLPILLVAVATFALLGMTAEAQEPAVYVGDEMCLSCHEEQILPARQIHARIRPFEVRGHAVGCEGCHGPGSQHLEELDPASLVRFAPGGVGDEACMDCHWRKGLPEWHASTHAMENVGCSDCHSTHHLSPHQSAADYALDSCQTCHGDVVALFQMPSHHPVREGKMDCASCHNVHNSRERMLDTPLGTNELCYTCHQAIEGPFIFEHAPVEEDCRLCHVPHGSVVNNLLTANEPSLCLQCHEFHFHAGYRGSDSAEVEVGGTPRENPFGQAGFNIAFTTKCTQCHAKVHGSDLPAQSVPGSGRGLTH